MAIGGYLNRSARKHVTNEEYERALYGLPGDEASLKAASDNRNVILGVTNRYNKSLSQDELHSCGLRALWRALQYHQDGFGKKFTTSLYMFTVWECNREVRCRKGKQSAPMLSLYDDEATKRESKSVLSREEDLEHVLSRLEQLPYGLRVAFRQYYLDGLTMEEIGKRNGYSKESARNRIDKALLLLRRACREGLD